MYCMKKKTPWFIIGELHRTTDLRSQGKNANKK